VLFVLAGVPQATVIVTAAGSFVRRKAVGTPSTTHGCGRPPRGCAPRRPRCRRPSRLVRLLERLAAGGATAPLRGRA
jgi:hypothetical protein